MISIPLSAWRVVAGPPEAEIGARFYETCDHRKSDGWPVVRPIKKRRKFARKNKDLQATATSWSVPRMPRGISPSSGPRSAIRGRSFGLCKAKALPGAVRAQWSLAASDYLGQRMWRRGGYAAAPGKCGGCDAGASRCSAPAPLHPGTSALRGIPDAPAMWSAGPPLTRSCHSPMG